MNCIESSVMYVVLYGVPVLGRKELRERRTQAFDLTIFLKIRFLSIERRKDIDL